MRLVTDHNDYSLFPFLSLPLSISFCELVLPRLVCALHTNVTSLQSLLIWSLYHYHRGKSVCSSSNHKCRLTLTKKVYGTKIWIAFLLCWLMFAPFISVFFVSSLLFRHQSYTTWVNTLNVCNVILANVSTIMMTSNLSFVYSLLSFLFRFHSFLFDAPRSATQEV